MGERIPDYNKIVIDKIVREVQHERNCGCMRCMGKARQSIAWVNEQSPTVKRENAEREQKVIDFLHKHETPEQHDSRMSNMLEEEHLDGMLILVGQGYSGLVRLMDTGSDPGDEQFYG